MSINFDVVVDTPEMSIDMKAGLETFQGISDATRIIAQTILNERTPERLSYKSNVRTSLKRSFTGSYGQIFSLDIYDERLSNRLNAIGRSTFLELMKYFIEEALYQDHGGNDLSEKAAGVWNRLGDVSEKLVEQLRASSLEKMHQISMKFGYDARLRFRKSNQSQITIAKFDAETAEALEVTEDNEAVDLVVSITRLNINTGNGRLMELGKNETVAFGFASEYRILQTRAKKLFSTNLDKNNGVDQKHWEVLRVSAKPLRLKSGKIIKYILTRFEL